MTRRGNAYRSGPLETLSRQLLFAPPEKRAEMVPRVEALHDEVDPTAVYPLDYVVYRITRYRRDAGEDVLLVGEALLPDLRLLIDALSRSVDLPIDGVPGTATTDDLAIRLNVSTKTIGRWRDAGLRWRWVVPAAGGRKVVAFTPGAVEQFIARNRERVEKASAFTQIPPEDRQRIVVRARRLAQQRELSLNQVAAHLAKRTGRALETIRQILETHDREPPGDRLFDEAGPLTPRQRRVIARAHRMGVSATKMAERFGRSRATVYRVINERRLAAARRVPLRWVESPTFSRDDADEVILRGEVEPFPANRMRHMSSVPIDDLPEPLRALYRQPQIEDDRQRSLFVRFNYLKYKAAKIRDRVHPRNPRAADLDAFERCLREADHIRGLLVKANLPTVLSVAKRQLLGSADRAGNRLLQFLELGTAVVLDAVEEFNPARSQAFTSFLTNRLMQAFVAAQTDAGRALRRVSADELAQRLVDRAHESGVALTLEDPA